MTSRKTPTLTDGRQALRSILTVRGRRVLLDHDLATLYGVETRRLNEQVRRNRTRFPPDFIFELRAREVADLKSQFATSSWGGRRKRPLVFTEHGAIMAATVLNSARAVEIGILKAIRDLMNPPVPKRRPIGFVYPEERK